MVRKNQPDRDLAAEADELIDELPDETAAGRMVRDDGSPADVEQWASDRQAAMRDKSRQSGSGAPTSSQEKRGNQPPPNPPKY